MLSWILSTSSWGSFRGMKTWNLAHSASQALGLALVINIYLSKFAARHKKIALSLIVVFVSLAFGFK